jgi:hypothetical protein
MAMVSLTGWFEVMEILGKIDAGKPLTVRERRLLDRFREHYLDEPDLASLDEGFPPEWLAE